MPVPLQLLNSNIVLLSLLLNKTKETQKNGANNSLNLIQMDSMEIVRHAEIEGPQKLAFISL